MEWTLPEDRRDPPLGRKKTTVYFAGSMADLFHEGVPGAFVDRVLAVIRQTSRHTDLLLTQRAARLAAFFAGRPPTANVGPGVTVEDRRYGLPRLDYLRQVPARVRPPRRTDGPLDDGITAWFAMQWLSN